MNTEDAYGQTWHLPVSTDRPTYREFVTIAGAAFGRDADYVSRFPEFAIATYADWLDTIGRLST